MTTLLEKIAEIRELRARALKMSLRELLYQFCEFGPDKWQSIVFLENLNEKLRGTTETGYQFLSPYCSGCSLTAGVAEPHLHDFCRTASKNCLIDLYLTAKNNGQLWLAGRLLIEIADFVKNVRWEDTNVWFNQLSNRILADKPCPRLVAIFEAKCLSLAEEQQTLKEKAN